MFQPAQSDDKFLKVGTPTMHYERVFSSLLFTDCLKFFRSLDKVMHLTLTLMY